MLDLSVYYGLFLIYVVAPLSVIGLLALVAF